MTTAPRESVALRAMGKRMELGERSRTTCPLNTLWLMEREAVMVSTKICHCYGSLYYYGGMFSTDWKVDKLIHVDVYLLGYPPKPEVIMDAIPKLYKVSQEIYEQYN